MAESDDFVARGYDAFYGAWGRSPTLRGIWREHVTGADFPEEFAHISFLSLADLRDIATSLDLAPGDVLVDLACGAGGPGLWVTRETGAHLRGRDLSGIAVQRATERALALDLEPAGRCDFARASFEETGLPSVSADAIMTIDALQYSPDKARAFTEIARVLRPARRFVFLAFELDPERVAGLPGWSDAVEDYRTLLEHAGLEVLRYEQRPRWQDQVAAGFGAVVAAEDDLVVELGEAAARGLLLEASMTLQLQPYRGHVLAVARKPAA